MSHRLFEEERAEQGPTLFTMRKEENLLCDIYLAITSPFISFLAWEK